MDLREYVKSLDYNTREELTRILLHDVSSEYIRGILSREHISLLEGEYTVTIRDVNGNVKSQATSRNMIMLTGKTDVLKLMKDTVGVTGVEYIAVGDSNVAENENQTTLGNELSRVAISAKTISSTGKTLTVSGFWDQATPNSTITVNEIGVFGNGASATPNSGDMYSRSVVTPQTKTVNQDTMTVEVKYSFS